MRQPSVSLLAVLGLLASSASAHMAIQSPPVRGSQYNKLSTSPDYNIKAPIGTKDSVTMPLCRGQPAEKPQTVVNPGDSIPIKFEDGGANHGGGHCQYSLSYDGGKTFVVIKSIPTTCLTGGVTDSVTIPSNAPSSDSVVLAWTWFNKIGNREMYMNCADIKIGGSNKNGKLTGHQMLIANYGAGTPLIPEGLGDSASMLDQTPMITVTGNGGSTPGGSDSPSYGSTQASSAGQPSSTAGSAPPAFPSPPADSPPVSNQGAAVNDNSGAYPSAAPTSDAYGAAPPSAAPSSDVYAAAPPSSAAPTSDAYAAAPSSDAASPASDTYAAAPSSSAYAVPTSDATAPTASAPAPQGNQQIIDTVSKCSASGNTAAPSSDAYAAAPSSDAASPASDAYAAPSSDAYAAPSGGSGSCTSGAMACDGDDGFTVCAQGTPISYKCPPGTKCTSKSGSAICM